MAVVRHWCETLRAEHAPSVLVRLAFPLALALAPSKVLAEPAPPQPSSGSAQPAPAPPVRDGDLPPPPPPPIGAVDNGVVTPAPASAPTDQPANAVPPPAEPYAPPPEPYVPPPEPYVSPRSGRHASRWYGWQTIATDAAAVALLTGGIVWAASTPLGGNDGPAVAMLGASYATFVLGAPIVHFAHANSKKGFGDLGLRVFGPPVAGLLGAVFCSAVCTDSGSGDFGDLRPLVGFVFGAMAGFVAVPIIDAAALAYEPKGPRTALAAPRVARLRVSWLPDVVVRRDHTVLVGARGAF